MPLTPIALPRFLRQYKKLPAKVQDDVQEQISRVLDDPGLGENKTGDISYIRVHKFKIKAQLYLLAYRVDDTGGELYLYAVDTHENFYRDLKKYLRA